MMFLQQFIGTIINTKILIDSLALNISIVPIKLNNEISEILDCYSITAKCTFTFRISFLQLLSLVFIQNESFQFVPLIFEINFYPAMEDTFWSITVNKPGHRSFLQAFINRKTMYSAWNIAGT